MLTEKEKEIVIEALRSKWQDIAFDVFNCYGSQDTYTGEEVSNIVADHVDIDLFWKATTEERKEVKEKAFPVNDLYSL